MAGTLFGLGLSQQVSSAGVPLSGALLYVYEANTSTPVTTYAEYALATAQTFPIEADSAGRLPQIWVADGSYRARLTTSAGVEVFDEASITAIGASSSGSSSGSGTSVSSEAIFQTGDTLWVPISGTRSGWVRLNGRTIGSGSSGSTERANSDTQDLFEYLWNAHSNTVCAVSGGRGANAAADFNANKTLTLISMRGRAGFGLDDMGNSAASVIAAGTPTTAATGSGGETVTLLQANLPSYNLSAASLTGSVATTITNGTSVVRSLTEDKRTDLAASGAQDAVEDITYTESTIALASGTVTFGGSVPSGGSGTATNKMPPYMLGTWYIKL
jgi:microcystin-dependent protein